MLETLAQEAFKISPLLEPGPGFNDQKVANHAETATYPIVSFIALNLLNHFDYASFISSIHHDLVVIGLADQTSYPIFEVDPKQARDEIFSKLDSFFIVLYIYNLLQQLSQLYFKAKLSYLLMAS